ncbi:hypothetical protein RJ639_011697 [Escallonia herrerae]|uniref:EF-hand domain-containing protein n=1 Tax=Escallonia herrerae TaxID=1293975 RepID=A0AA88VMP4_9ASTE|nr:hypothetical protein RJ639_011697 [Escallonia herrerae]
MAIMCCVQVQPKGEMTVDEFKTWLRRFDSDCDGRISHGELKEALRSLRIWFGWWKSRQAMKMVDSDQSGHIDSAQEIEKLVNYVQQNLNMKICESGCTGLVVLILAVYLQSLVSFSSQSS